MPHEQGLTLDHYFFNIDVVGSCNLRCPSCPVGNSDVALPRGLMDVETMERIADKALAECDLKGIGLFNWTEPLLHPRLASLIRVLREREIKVNISSNLNIAKRLDEILASDPTQFRVSLSGIKPDTYARYHRGGELATVLGNLQELADIRERTGAATRVHLLFHRYRDNLDEEPEVAKLAAELGFDFIGVWAFMMPLEKVLALRDPGLHPELLTEEDRALVDRLALDPSDALSATAPYRSRPCDLLEHQITLDWQGNVQLCCGLFDPERFGVGSYLEFPIEEIQRRKYEDPYCSRCTELGGHVYANYGAPEFDELAERKAGPVQVWEPPRPSRWTRMLGSVRHWASHS
ncbi:MAG: radical SAM protein [bacterium]|nr:radical SAM protein [bacterium]